MCEVDAGKPTHLSDTEGRRNPEAVPAAALALWERIDPDDEDQAVSRVAAVVSV